MPSIENPKPFADERHGLRKGAFKKAGVLAMANRGKNTNGSQFFLTLGEGARWTKALEGAYVAFGEVVEISSNGDRAAGGGGGGGGGAGGEGGLSPRDSSGHEICMDGFALLDKLNKIPTDDEERPIQAITVIGCGRLE